MNYTQVGKLAVWSHAAEGNPKARILLIHGLSEHSARHQNTIEFLTAHGFEVIRFDLRGAGLSDGRRQWVERFSHYLDDVKAVFDWIQQTQSPLPLFILGHSLGGALGIYFVADIKPKVLGLIVSAPAFLAGSSFSPLKLTTAKAMSHLWPTMKIPSTTWAAVSRDPEVIQALCEDPLTCHYNTVRQGAEIIKAVTRIPEKCQAIQCPTLIVHGSADKLTRLEGSYMILRALSCPDKTLVVLPDGYHEPHNDLDKHYYFQHIATWLERHLPDAHPIP